MVLSLIISILAFSFFWLAAAVYDVALLSLLFMLPLKTLRKLFYRIEAILHENYLGLIAFLLECYCGVDLIITTPDGKLEVSPNAIIISNHITDFDWVVLVGLLFRYRIAGHMRYLLKNSLKWFPVFGLVWYMHGFVWIKSRPFDKNGSAIDRQKSVQEDIETIHKGLDYLAKNKMPTWLVIFPEGTRASAKNKERSQKFCREKGLPTFENVLYPRTKGFVTCVDGFRKYASAVYDATIAYEGHDPDARNFDKPTLYKYFGLRGPKRVHLHISRHPIEDVSANSDQFCRQRCDTASRF
mmetsp:Transcript_16337/g.26983  ORF Transcript_16337/g.26983 Transcript_16337/m.26983 type:complete len:298 (+) Transcript_16337:102-995(+)